MKNYIKKLTLCVAALAATVPMFSASRAARLFTRALRPALPVGMAHCATGPFIAPSIQHAFKLPVFNALTVQPACDAEIASKLAGYVEKTFARQEVAKAFVPALLPDVSKALVPAVSKTQEAMVTGVASVVARDIVTPVVVAGGCSPKFDLVPVQTAKTTYSAVSELFIRCKQNATGKNAAIAAATVATIAVIAGTAYYIWSKPAANIATTIVGIPAVKPVVPDIENFVDQSGVSAVENPVVQTDAPVVQDSVSTFVKDDSVAQPSSYYSYVSGLCGTVWNKAKSFVVPTVKRNKKETAIATVGVAGLTGAFIHELQKQEAVKKAAQDTKKDDTTSEIEIVKDTTETPV